MQSIDYDLAFSFAGERREYVKATKEECEKLGLKVMFDEDMSNSWWGKNFLSEQRIIYGTKARYFVPFISPEYFKKPIPRDEFESAMWAAVERGNDYILPVTIEGAKAPPDKLHPHTGYLEAEKYTPEQLAQQFLTKLEKTNQPPKDIGVVVNDAIKFSMPKLTPRTFSKYKEADSTLEYLGKQFETRLPKLSEQDIIGTIKISDSRIVIRVEDEGKTIFGLTIFPADGMGEAMIGFNLGWRDVSTNSYHGTAQPYFDKERNSPALKIFDLSLFNTLGEDLNLTKEELFEKLWDRMVKDIENTANR